ncbi:hypothetical protein [Roseicitreum antarcticum]|nr:hypothetical protein [Roseicitreum antarcticum]
MEWLIWSGAFVSLLGVAGLIWCVVFALRARRAGMDDAALRAKLQKAMAMNLGALVVSTLGLMMVVLGIFLR